MSERFSSRRAQCERFAALLATLDRDDKGTSADTPAMAEARAHLASCPACQAAQRDYAALDGAVRTAFGAATAAPFRTADLLMAIGATSEPLSRRAGGAIRSVRYLKDFDDMEDQTMTPPTDERDPNGAAPATSLAAQPGSRPSRGAGLRRQAVTLGFSATAAAVILVVVAVSVFGSHLRHLTSRPANGSPTQTISLPATAAAGIAAISLDSPTDGWAMGDATLNPTGDPTGVGVGFYHYDGHIWRLTQRIAGLVIYEQSPARMTMFTPTNGWAYIPNNTAPLHYDGRSWSPAPIKLTGAEQLQQLVGFDMVSPTEGWAAAYLTGGSAGPGAIGFLHYDGKGWTVEKNVFAPSYADLRNTVISGFSSLPGGVVWAVGWTTNLDQQGYNMPVGLIFKRDNGVWSYFNQSYLNQGSAENGMPAMALDDIVMITPSSGWIVGEYEYMSKMPDGSPSVSTNALLLRYNFATTGPNWNPVTIPYNGQGRSPMYLRVVATSEQNVWIAGVSTEFTVYRSGFQVSSLLFHYDGASWTRVKPTIDTGQDATLTLSTFALAPNGDVWLAGGRITTGSPSATRPLMWRYHDGVWSAATVVIK